MRFETITFLDDEALGAPTEPADLDAAEERLGTTFPPQLRALLLRADGYNGEITDDRADDDEETYLRLHRVARIVEATEDGDAYHEDDEFPGAIEIGDQGGDVAFVYRVDEGGFRFALVESGSNDVVAWLGATFVDALHGIVHQYDDDADEDDADEDDIADWPRP